MVKHMKNNIKKNNFADKLHFVLLTTAVLLLAFVVWNYFFSTTSTSSVGPENTHLPLVVERDNISVEVQPLNLDSVENSEFSVAFNTHQGSLDFDPDKISVLQDNLGNKYLPLKWDGSPSGSHHRNGKLIFPKISDKSSAVDLFITINKSDRKFSWGLNK